MTAPDGGRLFLVATPIGNLEDISLRALRILKEADLIAAEDTRRTIKLLNHYKISTPLISYYKDIEHRRTAELIARLLEGRKIALVTDAGTPSVSDPGERLAAEALRHAVPVEVIPGASAVLTALLGSGLPADAFSFQGFLDTRSSQRKRKLEAWRYRPETQIFFAAPHRLDEVLDDLIAVWGGDRTAVLARELTKIHEEYLRGTLRELRAKIASVEPRGEYTLVVSGGTEEAPAMDESLEAQLQRLQREGLSLNQAVARAARERGLSRNEVYALAHGQEKLSEK